MDALQADDPVRLGPYRLEGRLSAGPGGRVYLGRSPGDRLAAVRLVDPRLAAEPGFRERLEREIAAVGRARVPWAAMILDAGLGGPQPWIATEFVPGEPLDHVVGTSGPLPAPALGVLAGRLAEALAALHARGTVHGDLDPSDVVVAADGPYLVDLGIAAVVRRVAGAASAPERVHGDPGGPAADVYSLAAVVAAAAGPVAAGSPAPAMARIPPDLRAVLEPCLSADPARRPPAAAVAAALAGPGAPDRRAAAPAPGRGGLGRAGAWFAGIAVVLVVALLVATVVITATRPVSAPPVARPVAPPVPTAPPSLPPPVPSSRAQPPLIPSSLPGWSAAVSTTRNAGYDVPPTWEPRSPTLIRGFVDPAGARVVMSGVAVYEDTAPSPCPGSGDDRYVLAWSGVTGAPTGDTAAAAAQVATRWSGAFDDPDEPGAPQVAVGPPVDVLTGGGRGSRVTADVTMPAGSCASARKAVHAVAVPAAAPGESVVLVLLAERDVPGALTDTEVAMIASTLRPAGLEDRCDPAADVLGSWC